LIPFEAEWCQIERAKLQFFQSYRGGRGAALRPGAQPAAGRRSRGGAQGYERDVVFGPAAAPLEWRPTLHPPRRSLRSPPSPFGVCFIRRNGLSLPKTEEAMTAPVGSGHRLGDLGEAAEGLATPGEAVLEDHDPLELAIPLSPSRAPPSCRRRLGSERPPVERNAALVLPAGPKHPLNRFVETAEGVSLQTIGGALISSQRGRSGGGSPAKWVRHRRRSPLRSWP
jgi:hypothetical protein